MSHFFGAFFFHLDYVVGLISKKATWTITFLYGMNFFEKQQRMFFGTSEKDQMKQQKSIIGSWSGTYSGWDKQQIPVLLTRKKTKDQCNVQLPTSAPQQSLFHRKIGSQVICRIHEATIYHCPTFPTQPKLGSLMDTGHHSFNAQWSNSTHHHFTLCAM